MPGSLTETEPVKVSGIIMQPTPTDSDVAFSKVPKGTIDQDHILNNLYASDPSSEKLDLIAGVYRDEKGSVKEFDVIKQAKRILVEKDLGHDYNSIYGVTGFEAATQGLLFGADSDVVTKKRIATFQTIGGTGSNHLGAAFLKQHYPFTSPYESPTPNNTRAYISVPAWPNHIPIFKHAGFDIENYEYFSPSTRSADFTSLIKAMKSAPKHSIFLLQAACHNPTGADYSQHQWAEVAEVMKARQLFPFFDSAYEGFGSSAANGGLDDTWPMRYFASQGFDMVVCQSFSKNFGLYGERVGALHVVCHNEEIAANVLDQIRCLVRWEYSSPPGFGGRLVTLTLSDKELRQQWEQQLGVAAAHVIGMRRRLFDLLSVELKTPGDWKFILDGKGLFSYFPLKKQQIEVVRERYHIFFPFTGRVNMAGMNEGNIEKVAMAIDYVSRITLE